MEHTPNNDGAYTIFCFLAMEHTPNSDGAYTILAMEHTPF